MEIIDSSAKRGCCIIFAFCSSPFAIWAILLNRSSDL